MTFLFIYIIFSLVSTRHASERASLCGGGVKLQAALDNKKRKDSERGTGVRGLHKLCDVIKARSLIASRHICI